MLEDGELDEKEGVAFFATTTKHDAIEGNSTEYTRGIFPCHILVGHPFSTESQRIANGLSVKYTFKTVVYAYVVFFITDPSTILFFILVKPILHHLHQIFTAQVSYTYMFDEGIFLFVLADDKLPLISVCGGIQVEVAFIGSFDMYV